MSKCKNIQDRIDLLNNDTINHDALISKHVGSCQECTSYLKAVQHLNNDLQEMTQLDAEDSLVDTTLASILSLQQNSLSESNESYKSKSKNTNYWLKPQWAHAIAASFMLISLIALFPYNTTSDYGLYPTGMDGVEQAVGKKDTSKSKVKNEESFVSPYDQEFNVDMIEVEMDSTVNHKSRRIPQKLNSPMMKEAPEPPKFSVNSSAIIADSVSATGLIDSPNESALQQIQEQITNQILEDKPLNQSLNHNNTSQNSMIVAKSLKDSKTGQIMDSFAKEKKQENAAKAEITNYSEAELEFEDKVQLEKVVTTGTHIRATEFDSIEDIADEVLDGDDDLVGLDSVTTSGSRIRSVDLSSASPVISMDREDKSDTLNDLDDSKVEFKKNTKKNNKNTDQRRSEMRQNTLTNTESTPENVNREITPEILELEEILNNNDQVQDNQLAIDYLNQLQNLEGLQFKNTSGYWANTYLPGDYAMRRLHSYVEERRDYFQDSKEMVSANIQPFDAPTNSAMQVYLSSDHTSLESQAPTRMRLQVGLQASDRKGGQRGDMNIGLVIDIQEKNRSKYAKEVKALLDSLLKSKQSGDQISLTTTGSDGGLKISPKDYRHGPIQVAINHYINHPNNESQQTDLLEALRIAIESTKSLDDPQSSLGNSLILLISDQSNEDTSVEGSMIADFIHNNATQGIVLSTVSMNQESDQLLRDWALKGQGHFRFLQSEIDAKRIINEELLASSKAVARALRLRIRLADGVKLVNILGSYNLNEVQSQQVRDAEKSIDQRLSRNLGITADRGEDEEGIQIVIPAFYAGDTHVILLDVVAEKTGPLADVSLRYKDLIYLKNSQELKQLNLDRQTNKIGPLQLNVIKNVLAQKFSTQMSLASSLLKNNQQTKAVVLLTNIQALYQSMQYHYQNWKTDDEINNDIKLLEKYINLLKNLTSENSQKLDYIVSSLQYISWKKFISNPI